MAALSGAWKQAENIIFQNCWYCGKKTYGGKFSLKFIFRSRDPQGQIQGQSIGQKVIKPKHVPTKKVKADLESYAITFPKTPISTNLTQRLTIYGRLNIGSRAHFNQNQPERACCSTKTVYRMEPKFEMLACWAAITP